MQKAVRDGCDAVEVDCLDIHERRSDYTKNDAKIFAKWVAETAQQVGISVGLKNLATLAPELEPYFDFAVVESCAEYVDICKYFKVFTAHNKAVFTIHYNDRKHNFSRYGSPEKTLSKELGGYGFTCAYTPYQNIEDRSTNFDCSKGNYWDGNYFYLFIYLFILNIKKKYKVSISL